ncbi:uncharacterized protein CCR75_001512 [Bremia lactucae]|uniref:Pectinesterase n=1 Tax=Bremia lactucae TaxID=4779 RepID=A0A976FG16_BRELC|nr:hypothetical protein CCR75_001512 [Bremia lactucae]
MRFLSYSLAVCATFVVTTYGDDCNGSPNARTTPPPGAVVVDSTGKYAGSVTTINLGVAQLQASSSPQSLFIFPGTFNEQIFIGKDVKSLIIQGYTCDTTDYTQNQVTITHSKSQNDLPSSVTSNRNFLTSTLGIESASAKVYNLNVANTAGQIEINGQAVAISSSGKSQGFYACSIKGYQDTLFAHKGRQLYVKSHIRGAVDFVFGQNAVAWFESCTIESIGKGWLTANGNTKPENENGYVFNNCQVTGTGPTFLGRPWNPYARVVFQKCQLGSHIDPKGWSPWGDSASLDTVTFAEYGNTGPGSKTDQRVPFSTQLDKAKDIKEVLGDGYMDEWFVDSLFQK